MSRSSIKTLLTLEDYAKVMAIPGWLFNQCSHPGMARRGPYDQVFYQTGYFGDEELIIGRDQIARAISQAERKIAEILGYWPAQRYIEEEQTPMPLKSDVVYPKMQTRWGMLQAFGVKTTTTIAEDLTVSYSDEDGDGYDDTATITINLIDAASVSDLCRLIVRPDGYGESYEIAPLEAEEQADGSIELTGKRWLFVLPSIWNTDEQASLDDDADFVTTVDVYEESTDTTDQVTLIWSATLDNFAQSTQSAFGLIEDQRVGLFRVLPATYGDGAWVRATLAKTRLPDFYKYNYLSGYKDEFNDCSFEMNQELKQAVVSLANLYLPYDPAGVDFTRERFREDTEEIDVRTMIHHVVQRTFGSVTKGTMRVYAILDSLPQIGQGF